jgi:hypothetical protein
MGVDWHPHTLSEEDIKMSVVAHSGILSLAAQKIRDRETVVVADATFPAITAQNVGQDIYQGRQNKVRIIGDKHSLGKIAWIFRKVPDMFALRFQCSSLVVSRVPEWQTKRQNCVKTRKITKHPPVRLVRRLVYGRAANKQKGVLPVKPKNVSALQNLDVVEGER